MKNSDHMAKTIKKVLNEDCIELISYVEKENLPYKEELLTLLEKDQNALYGLENIILQLSRVFGICAFEQDNSLETFRSRIEKDLTTYPIFKNIIRIYQNQASLLDINPELTDKLFAQEQKLDDFLNSLK